MRADNVFWIASMSKPITAAGLLMLVDEGKVKLDDPVEKYLPEFKGQMVVTEKDADHVLLRKRHARAVEQLDRPGERPRVERPPGLPPQLAGKVQRIQQRVQEMQRNGQDVSPIAEVMRRLGPAVQAGKTAEAEKIVAEAFRAVAVVLLRGGVRDDGRRRPVAPQAVAKEHGPFKADDPTIPYLDVAKVSQAYKFYADPKPKVVKAGPVNAATMSKAAEELIAAELADRKCKPHTGACLRAGDKWLCTYQLQYEGIPLAKTTDAMCIIHHDGHALIFRERNVPRKVNATKATVERKAAALVAQEDFKRRTKAEKAEATDPSLEIWVEGELQGHLCWTFTIMNGSVVKPQAARYWVAAVGDVRVMAVENLLHHVQGGSVTGAVWATTPLQPTQSLPLSYLDVTCGKIRGPRPTGPGGEYAFIPAGGSARIRVKLAGPACVIENHGEGPVLARDRRGDEGGPINLDFDAKGEFEIAQVSAFYWTGVARDFAKDFLLPSHLWRLTTRVNLDDTCNAGFNGADVSINFFRAGNGCLNTAFSDIVLHEYGHAIDFVHGGILDGGYSEGFGDALAILVTQQPLVGRDLNGPGSAIRDARKFVMYPSSRPEPHFVGQIYAGFIWELIQQLQKHGHRSGEDAFEVAKRLILAADAMNPKDIPDAVRLAFLADDDDGHLTNGSPHFAELAAAADSRKIPRPPDPVTTPGPRHAYIGRLGTHHLVAGAGTGMYFWNSAERLVTLKLEKADADFWYYCEKGPPGHRWAFGRKANSSGRFAVWFIPADSSEGRRTFFHFAQRVTPDFPSPAKRK